MEANMKFYCIYSDFYIEGLVTFPEESYYTINRIGFCHGLVL